MAEADVPEVDVAELARARARGAAVLDVRQPDEFEEVRVPGGVLVPLDQLEDRLADVPEGDPIYVICRSGGRSLAASRWLREQGREAVNVAGGTLAWAEAGYETDSGPPDAT